ncbi:restriction endonuclease subunit S [Rhizomonospora bruguierae]|uniref:restriction endonuclease subunit S n=1 Tax=Rhizomonospora bruguierae TaxID=1581705 RepID=UPI001BCE0495|nr:restriction endonuclease subunit S [Micromonospora sp. NBRC 107566]
MTQLLGISLPDHWTTSPLKHVTTLLNRGSTPNYVDNGPVRALSQAANQDSGIDWQRTRFHDYHGDSAKLRGRLRQGDVIINSTGTGTLGRIGQFEGNLDGIPSMADSHLTVARFRPDFVYPRFAYYWLRSQPFQEYIYAALVVGATNQIELNRDRLAVADLPLPPMNEQRHIADFLDAETAHTDRLIALQREIITRLHERDVAILDAEIDQLARKAGTLPFRRFTAGVDQGSSPQCEGIPAADGEWGVLKVSCLRPGEFFPDENKRLPVNLAPDVTHEVHEGDLLITRANTPQLVGSTAVVPPGRSRLLLSDKIFRVRLLPKLDPHYLTAIARGTQIRSLCSATSNGASQSMANIRFEEIKDWPIPAASLKEQRDLVVRMNSVWDITRRLRTKLQHQLTLLNERRQALITSAVTGQIDLSTASTRGDS